MVAAERGVEVAYRSVELALAAFPDFGAALFDARNAFNTMLRSCIFRKLKATFPQFLPHLRMVYRNPKKLYVRGSAGMVTADRGME